MPHAANMSSDQPTEFPTNPHSPRQIAAAAQAGADTAKPREYQFGTNLLAEAFSWQYGVAFICPLNQAHTGYHLTRSIMTHMNDWLSMTASALGRDIRFTPTRTVAANL